MEPGLEASTLFPEALQNLQGPIQDLQTGPGFKALCNQSSTNHPGANTGYTSYKDHLFSPL